jgi:hypothetical protein
MSDFTSAPGGAAAAASLASSDRDQWAWLDSLGRSLECAILLVDAQGTPGLVLGAASPGDSVRDLLGRSDPALSGAIKRALDTERPHQAVTGSLSLICRRLTVQRQVAGAIVVVGPANAGHYVRFEPWLAAAAEAHLGQRASDEHEEAFDRISSLHRLLHDGVEGGNEREVLTAFAEALFAWDGIEAIGYVEDVNGEWMRAMAPPGASAAAVLPPHLGQRLRSKQAARLGADDLGRLAFPSERHVVALTISETTPEPWLLLFSEGYRPLNLSRLNLYTDLLRDALTRLSSIVETRAAWAILQTLLGATEPIDTAIDGALREFSRVVDGLAVSLIVTNATGTTLLVAGDRESLTLVRPFDRGNRLVSTVHLPDLGTMQLAVRRARGQSFTRREQHLVDRAASIFSAWLPGALKQPVEKTGEGAATRGFEEVLERAATQITRDGLDVSVVVIPVPENGGRMTTLQSWVTEIRARLRGTDLAGAISDGEIGVLLSGTSQNDVPIVCARLGRSLGLEKDAGSTVLGSATRAAGSLEEESIVNVARRNAGGRRPKATRRSLQ